MATDNLNIAQAYDEVPYQSRPFPQSRPEHLSVIAKLLGIDSPDYKKARVLELGSSAGGNIIPLAERYPEAYFIGVDISPVQIEYGKKIIQQLGLRNCDLTTLDIVHASHELTGEFDYIICHGVFSWVPSVVREAILKLIQTKLSSSGIAFISYNTFPGWKANQVVRDLMLFHAGTRSTAQEKIQQSRAILNHVQRYSDEQTPYGQLMRSISSHLSVTPDDYIYHEYLESDNQPLYFRDFMRTAADFGLDYLGEASLKDMMPNRLPVEVENSLQLLAENNIIAKEQYIDFFTNRGFRRTLLVKAEQAKKINRQLSWDRLRGLYFSTILVEDAGFVATPGQLPLAKFSMGGMGEVGVHSELSLALIRCLSAARPLALSLEQIAETVGANSADAQGIARADLIALICEELIKLTSIDSIKIALEPGQTCATGANAAQLKAPDLARLQTQLGQTWVTGSNHVSHDLSPVQRELLQLMNGERTQEQLLEQLLTYFKNGKLKAYKNGSLIQDEHELSLANREIYKTTLINFKEMGLID